MQIESPRSKPRVQSLAQSANRLQTTTGSRLLPEKSRKTSQYLELCGMRSRPETPLCSLVRQCLKKKPISRHAAARSFADNCRAGALSSVEGEAGRRPEGPAEPTREEELAAEGVGSTGSAVATRVGDEVAWVSGTKVKDCSDWASAEACKGKPGNQFLKMSDAKL